MAKISVIVPVYKAEAFLCRCIDGILNQTFQDFELILVNDGSPDNCGAICDAYAAKDSRVRVIHQENRGASAARNAGLDAARGDYIAFCDSDDLVAPKWLEHLYGCAGPGLWPLCSHCDQIEGLGQERSLPGVGTQPHSAKDFYLLGLVGFLWNTLFDASVIRSNHMRLRTQHDKGDYNEDLIFCLQYQTHMSRILYTGYADYLYDVREGSLSRSYSKHYFEKYEEKYILIRRALEANGVEEQKKLLATSMLFRFLTALNHASYPETKRILASEAVQEAVRIGDSSRENPRILHLIKKNAALRLWLRLKIHHLKGRLL